jgi:hypothetical protein
MCDTYNTSNISGAVDIENNNNTVNDACVSSRDRYVNNVKTEMVFFNFGLPSNPNNVNLQWEDVVPKIRALRELHVRLNVYLANGRPQSGKIEYPEAGRMIEYNFDGDNIDKSYVRFYSTRNDCDVKSKK